MWRMQVWVKAILSAASVAAITGLTASAQAAGCAEPEIARAAGQVDLARKALIALPIGDGGETKVSPNVQRAIRIMKTRLAAFIDADMHCSSLNRDADAIQRDLSERAHAFVMENRVYKNDEPLPKDFGHYGFELDFRVKRWTDKPNRVGIVADFGIECGWDAILQIFSAESDRWHEVLRWQSKPYKTVGGAFGSFDYAVSPADAVGKWYVLAKTIAPWCSSAWSSISFAALRPVPGRLNPRIIHQQDDPIWWGGDDEGQLIAGRSEFEIRFHAQSIDVGVHNRVWIRHFQIAGDAVKRIPPVALSPRDFVDEWIVSSWNEASFWTIPASRQSAKVVHERLHNVYTGRGGDFFDYDAIRQCTNRADRYQIGLIRDEDQTRYFFSVVGETDYRLTGVTEMPDPACDRPDISGTMDAP